MEITILNSILFKELMPWTFDPKSVRAINDKIKRIGDKKPATETELIQQLEILVEDLPDLAKWLKKQTPKNNNPIANHCFAIDYPAYFNAITKFYSLIISLETLRVYNAFNAKMQKYSKKVDIVYHTTIALKNIKALTVNTAKEIKERGFEEVPTEQSLLSHFVLQLLRQHLTVLYFDIQEFSNASLDNQTSIEDFYMIDLQLPKSLIPEIQKIEQEEIPTKSGANKCKLSFGFTGDKDKLKIVVSLLQSKIELLNEDKTTSEQLFTLLTSKNIIPGGLKIYLNCETAVFRDVIDKLKVVFSNLKATTIDQSLSFYSKNNTLLNAQNLYSSKVSKSKERENIDYILKQLQ